MSAEELSSRLRLLPNDTVLLLVRMLGQHQLGGRYQVEQRQGTCFTLTFTPRNGDHAHA